MGRHGHGNHGEWRGGGSRDWSRPPVAGAGPAYAPRKATPLLWLMAIAGAALWSVFAWGALLLADPVMTWLATSTGSLLDAGKNIGTAVGVGKEVGVAVDSLNATGITGQILALLALLLKPAIIIVWLLGAIAILVAPALLPRVLGFVGSRRH